MRSPSQWSCAVSATARSGPGSAASRLDRGIGSSWESWASWRLATSACDSPTPAGSRDAMAPFQLRLAVGIGLVVLGLFGALTGTFFTGLTPDGRLAQLATGRIL